MMFYFKKINNKYIDRLFKPYAHQIKKHIRCMKAKYVTLQMNSEQSRILEFDSKLWKGRQ